MALTRFNGNVVPFASESTTDNRTVFGDVVQADDIDSNLNADFKKGWEIVGLNDNPTKQDFNAMGYTLGALTSYLYQMGIAEYNASQEYKLNAVCIGTDGTIYQSLVDANIGNALNDVSKWKNINNSFVDLVNNQSVYGIKAFVKSPIVPTPINGNEAVNKDYVDTALLPIGTILNGYTIFSNCIVAFGGEFNRADYPKLWAYLQANPSLVKTQAEWTTENTTNGMCGFFSYGNETTTFRVPNLNKAFLRPDSRGVGSFQYDAFQGHIHRVTSDKSGYGGTGGSYLAGESRSPVALYTGTPLSDGLNGTPRTAEETRPKNIAVLPLIVAK